MTSHHPLRIAFIAAALACSGAAFGATAASAASAAAKGTGTHQTHHCKQADGSMDMGKTKKACMADKGTWLKDGAAAAAPAPMASASAKK